jgi:hypothetical protein
VTLRRLVAVAAVVAVIAAVGVAVVVARRDRGPLAGPRDLIGRDAGWDSAGHAAETLAAVGEDLLRAGKACGAGAHCDDILSASAWAQVSAVLVLRCTRPVIFRTRADARALVDSLVHAPTRRAVLPATPAC